MKSETGNPAHWHTQARVTRTHVHVYIARVCIRTSNLCSECSLINVIMLNCGGRRTSSSRKTMSVHDMVGKTRKKSIVS